MNNDFTDEQLTEACDWVNSKYKGDLPDNLFIQVLADKLGVRPSAVRDRLEQLGDVDA